MLSLTENQFGGGRTPDFGAFIVSLDLELHWGVRDRCTVDDPYCENLLGERKMASALLGVFEEFGIAATWATVGFLFAGTRTELEAYLPRVRPLYRNTRLDPYRQPVGAGERDDPLHYGKSLVEMIRQAPRQEIATHTFSHYFCLEAGQTKEAFAADLASASAIAAASGVTLRSIVFPRNQFNPAYSSVLRQAGIRCFRGPQNGWMHRPRARKQESPWIRAGRLLDHYVPLSGSPATAWKDMPAGNGLVNTPANMFLRPWSQSLARWERRRIQRIVEGLETAARQKAVFHLWWHPHNFGRHAEENLGTLREILRHFVRLRDRSGLRSLTMGEAAEVAIGRMAAAA